MFYMVFVVGFDSCCYFLDGIVVPLVVVAATSALLVIVSHVVVFADVVEASGVRT